MRPQGTRHQTDAPGQQHEHHNRAEQAGRLEIDVKVQDYGREDDHDADKQEQPPDLRPAVEEQEADAEDERHKREAEGVVAPERPPPARHGDITGQ